MELSEILQKFILNISTEVFLNRLVLFNLISLNEYELLEKSMAREQQQKTNITTITTFMVERLNNENAIYHEKFKIFLGYYKDLNFVYRTWETLGWILTVNLDVFSLHYTKSC